MRVQLPGVGKSIDAIVKEAFAYLGCKPWGGPSATGWSKQKDFQRCPRRYQLIHELGAVPALANIESTKGLDIGAVGHVLLAAHYARYLPDDSYPGWQQNPPEPLAVLDALEKFGLAIELRAEVERLFSGYLEFYANETIQPCAVEMPAGDAKFHTSRFDLILYAQDGIHDGLWIGEHKFLKSSTDIEEYRLDGEVLGELLSFELSKLSEFFGMPVNGVCLNVIFKPTKTGLPRYQRLWISPPYEVIKRYAEDRAYWLNSLMLCKRVGGIWPKALNGCTTKYRTCRFFNHCRDLDDGQIQLLGPPKPSEE